MLLIRYWFSDTVTVQQAIIKVQGTKFIDTGGGFLLEENPSKVDTQPTIVTKPPPIIERTLKPTCIECNQEFSSSYLFETFDYHVCDNCRFFLYISLIQITRFSK